eukprot:11003304-Ditylum_brightwellii.AAC.1
MFGDDMLTLSDGGNEISNTVNSAGVDVSFNGVTKTTGGIPTAIHISDIAIITSWDEIGFITEISKEIENTGKVPEEWSQEYYGLGGYWTSCNTGNPVEHLGKHI